MSYKHLMRNRLTKNVGGAQPIFYLAPVSEFLLLKAPYVLKPELMDNVYADNAARDAATPSAFDTCYVTATGAYFIRIGSSWVVLDSVTIHESHTFAAGKGFIKIESTQDKNNFTGEGPSEMDVTGFMFKIPFHIPGMDVDKAEFDKKLALESFILLKRDRDGQVFQFGSASEPVTIRATSITTGENAAALKGTTYEATVSQSGLLFYNGAITEKP